jgi:iron complex transport system ATP-binding protein
MEPSSMPAETSILAVSNVSLWRAETKILQDVSWRIEPGQHWAVLGPNGAGKTTLLNVVTGYLWPSRGEVEVLGCRFGSVDLRDLRKRIGWVSSALQTRMPPGAEAVDIVASGLHASIGLYETISPAQHRRAEDLLEQMHCGALRRSAWGTLSLGEQQRVLIARALMAAPPLLILDEPCAGLDMPGRELDRKSVV